MVFSKRNREHKRDEVESSEHVTQSLPHGSDVIAASLATVTPWSEVISLFQAFVGEYLYEDFYKLLEIYQNLGHHNLVFGFETSECRPLLSFSYSILDMQWRLMRNLNVRLPLISFIIRYIFSSFLFYWPRAHHEPANNCLQNNGLLMLSTV